LLQTIQWLIKSTHEVFLLLSLIRGFHDTLLSFFLSRFKYLCMSTLIIYLFYSFPECIEAFHAESPKRSWYCSRVGIILNAIPAWIIATETTYNILVLEGIRICYTLQSSYITNYYSIIKLNWRNIHSSHKTTTPVGYICKMCIPKMASILSRTPSAIMSFVLTISHITVHKNDSPALLHIYELLKWSPLKL